MTSVAREMQTIRILSKNGSHKHPFFSEMLIKQKNTVETLTKQHEGLAVKCRQPYDLFVRHKIKLIKQRIVLGQVLIMVDLLLSTKPHTVNYITNTTATIIVCIKVQLVSTYKDAFQCCAFPLEIADVLRAGFPSCIPTNSVKALKELKALGPTWVNHPLNPILSWFLVKGSCALYTSSLSPVHSDVQEAVSLRSR